MQSGEPLNLKFNHSVSNSNCAAAELMEMRAMVLDAGSSVTTTTPHSKIANFRFSCHYQFLSQQLHTSGV
jgi:hypothetical protein